MAVDSTDRELGRVRSIFLPRAADHVAELAEHEAKRAAKRAA